MSNCVGCITKDCTRLNKFLMAPKNVPKCPGYESDGLPRRARVEGIWTNAYVQKLGIQDHCIEVLELLDQLRSLKLRSDSETTVKEVSAGLEREVMDLFIILDKWSESRSELHADRLARFIEKGRMDGR